MITGRPEPLTQKRRWAALLGNEAAFSSDCRLTPNAGSLKAQKEKHNSVIAFEFIYSLILSD